MKLLLVIGTGSFMGGILRYLLSQFVQSKSLAAFPFGTLTVNILGCFLIGIIFGLSDKANITNEWRLFFATGLLGGFTTFSAFSMETVSLLRDGQHLFAATYISASILAGIIALFVGLAIIKLF